MKKTLRIIFLIVIAAFISVNISIKKQEKKNAPVEQSIEFVKITVTAPPLKRREILEQKTKDALKDKIKSAYFFSSSYKKSDYVVYYCEYKNEVNLQAGIDSVISKLKDNKLVYEVKDNPVGSYSGALLEGAFEKDGKKFAIKDLLIKDEKNFWQVMSIYPHSKKNNKAAERFIKSVSFGSLAKSNEI
jgi:hypothetical protein